ncbi:MAG: GT2 family glycosyltransferase [Aureispira sp.]|jgi:GT2 family glycosyltransferase
MKQVAVIIINYNTSKFTLECIQAVVAKTSETIPYEIIVVDNNSELSDYKNLKKHFPNQPNITLHRSNINTGFGGGNMFGSQFANARYVLFLNNDAMLKNDCISILYQFMEDNQKVGVCTAQNYDEHDTFVPSFDHNKGIRRLLFGRSFLEKINPKVYPNRKKEYTTPLEVNWVNGSFLFFRNDAFEKIGGFDTNIFLYCEEMDLCNRLRLQGYSSVLVPQATILHYQSKSSGFSDTINKEAMLSELYVNKKHNSFLHYKMIQLYYLISLPFKPKKWYLLPVILRGCSLKHSLKQKQTLRFLPSDNSATNE